MNRRLILAAGCAVMLLLGACATTPPTPAIVGLPAGAHGPTLSYPDGGMFFYVENNGRYVVALNGDGDTVWRCDPFDEYPAVGEKVTPINALKTPGYDPGSGRRVLMVYSATGFRGLDMVTGAYLLG